MTLGAKIFCDNQIFFSTKGQYTDRTEQRAGPKNIRPALVSDVCFYRECLPPILPLRGAGPLSRVLCLLPENLSCRTGCHPPVRRLLLPPSGASAPSSSPTGRTAAFLIFCQPVKHGSWLSSYVLPLKFRAASIPESVSSRFIWRLSLLILPAHDITARFYLIENLAEGNLTALPACPEAPAV